ncbi:uncharacterized protein METZ01_LOCUS503261, partial [marine metagenome]
MVDKLLIDFSIAFQKSQEYLIRLCAYLTLSI